LDRQTDELQEFVARMRWELVDHGDVRDLMDDGVLATIAHDLVEAIRSSDTIDWTAKEAVRAGGEGSGDFSANRLPT
jgi:hypothetical protein